MGRPVKDDVLGTLVFGDYATTSAGIKVSARIPGFGTAKAGYIEKQVGSRNYRVTNADGTGKCLLVSSITDEGQVVMLGYTNPGADISVAIRKLNKRTAIDFSGNRYTWYLVNDSSEDYIQLTAI
jgi:hypothetical protein